MSKPYFYFNWKLNPETNSIDWLLTTFGDYKKYGFACDPDMSMRNAINIEPVPLVQCEGPIYEAVIDAPINGSTTDQITASIVEQLVAIGGEQKNDLQVAKPSDFYFYIHCQAEDLHEICYTFLITPKKYFDTHKKVNNDTWVNQTVIPKFFGRLPKAGNSEYAYAGDAVAGIRVLSNAGFVMNPALKNRPLTKHDMEESE